MIPKGFYYLSPRMKIKKILIANRGEIARRVIRTAKEMSIETVAIYSEADAESPHVNEASEAYCIGPPAAKDSYLRADKIIALAKECGADAIHPGYGFLSENGEFSKAIQVAGLIFIGPDAHAIRVMGNKLLAKDAVKDFGIPMVPGTDQAIDDVEEAKRIAEEIGFPILIKAAAGGGGKGMRVVEKSDDFVEQMDRAQNEALSSFGDGSVFIEKFITSPRHIEVQVMSDRKGNHLYLFERECSIQRRHQKVVEEAPSSILTPEMRKVMGEAATNVARSCDYVGAGTVEFLVDEKLNFYFLEMNTRLQVEHPVTEEITGLDLVKMQIEIAEGKAMSVKQEDLKINGHSIELRVYAEDASNNFAPDIGRLERYQLPQGPGVRVDDGIVAGQDISIYYDPMIAKLVVWAEDREKAINRMIRAIDEYEIAPVRTTLDFGKYAVDHQAFRSGKFDTNFIKKHFVAKDLGGNLEPDENEILAALSVIETENRTTSVNSGKHSKNGAKSGAWKLNRT